MSSPFIGINNYVCPAQIREKSGILQPTVASVDFLARTAQDSAACAETMLGLLERRLLSDVHSARFAPLLAEACDRLAADEANMTISFPFFLRKKAPVSAIPGLIECRCAFSASLRSDRPAESAAGNAAALELRAAVPVTTLCPCSREISRFGAHNQRAEIRLRARAEGEVWLEDLIHLAQRCGSAEIYSLLKREDEKRVTEQAYAHPMFVEDVAREVAQRVGALAGIGWFSVDVESFESIHGHNAYAFIDSGDLSAPA